MAAFHTVPLFALMVAEKIALLQLVASIVPVVRSNVAARSTFWL